MSPASVAGGQPPVHSPVLLDRVLELLDPVCRRPGAVVVDATVGLGGHTAALLTRHPGLTVVGLDRDTQALGRATSRLACFGERARLVHTGYDELGTVLAGAGVASVDGLLFDLGVSSLQLDDDERGFAYSRDTALDMRMTNDSGLTAADVLNSYSEVEITRVLRDYGEERFARRIAHAIVTGRERQPWTTSARLVDLVRDNVPAATRRTGGNPAKRTFQALRIEVNDELGGLRRALPQALDVLGPGGRLVVLAYHSLEDRIVKRVLVAAASSTAPVDLPVEPAGTEPRVRLLVRGEPASDVEIAQNPRAASVRLRAVERIGVAA